MKHVIKWLMAIILIFLVNSIRSDYLIQRTTKSITDSQEIEKNILIELFQSTNGFNWTRKDNWLSSNISICHWFGVECNNDSNVIGISLSSNQLLGTIPDSIGQLDSLQTLGLRFNQLSGTIPVTPLDNLIAFEH
jgi:hypothetical protein